MVACPSPWLYFEDGDLIAIVQHTILARWPGIVRVTEVKGHATETDVEQGRVRRTGLRTWRLILRLG